MKSLPKGPRNAHINESYGPDTNLMKFYITTNSTTYGKHYDTFKPRQGRHTGTGYLSNFRPGVYYNASLDKLDNPVMAQICSKNYTSITQRDFQGYRENSGVEPLPHRVHQVGSGFVRQKPITFPTENEANRVFIDKRAASAPANIPPRAKPLLHTLNAKDPVELENSGYGPKYMVTESQQHFKGLPPEGKDLSIKTVGPKESSGFTHAKNIEPITFNPDTPHQNDIPGWYTQRPTGTSMMKTAFLPSRYPNGAEPFKTMAFGQERDTGYTREKAKPLYLHRNMADAYDKAGNMPDSRLDKMKKTDPTEFLNVMNPHNHTSIAKDIFKGEQLPEATGPGRLGRTNIGNHENTGFSATGDRFINVNDDPNRFITHYMTRFTNPTDMGKSREGHCRGGLQTQKPDGFTKSTAVHSYGASTNSTSQLRNMEPYVARSIKARDVFYDDHNHDAKIHTVQLAA